jgi:hypothetical protein
MTGSGDRLHDVRQRPTFQIDRDAIAFIPQVGPAAWAVYCFLIARATAGDSYWPDDLTIASSCGISTYNARLCVNALITNGLIARHQWTSETGGPATFAVMPVPAEPLADAPEASVGPAREASSLGTDRLVAEDTAEEDRWSQEAQERNATRELFSRLLGALGVDPADLSEKARTTVTEASRLARAARATPDDVENMIDRIRRDQPDLVLDAERMLEYWSRLFEDIGEESNDDPDAS